jgi:hypothetical protein
MLTLPSGQNGDDFLRLKKLRRRNQRMLRRGSG